MEQFVLPKIEMLKVRLYTIIGRLQFEKNIIIPNVNLQLLEKCLESCESEVEVSAIILGAIRRYGLMLERNVEIENVSSDVASAIEHENNALSTESFEEHPNEMDRAENTETINNLSGNSSEYVVSNNVTSAIDHENNALSTEPLEEHTNEMVALDVLNTIEGNVSSDYHAVFSTNEQVDNGIELAMTNTLIDNIPHVDESKLQTTKENKSFFLIYAKINDYDVGCEFTLRRNSKFPRYECKKCRSFCDRDKKSGVTDESPAAVSMAGNEIRVMKKSSHHHECRVEFAGTALARTHKNAAVVFKSKYGGTCKQVYDKHTQILSVSGKHLTAYDVAHGFQTYEYAQSALKKADQRKCAIHLPKVNIVESQEIDKLSTIILKSLPNEKTDYFLIGQDENAGVIVLGSKFLVERFFRSKKAMSDGTFQMAPVGYKQAYMLWYILEGIYRDEIVERSKAILSVIFILKGKSEAIYKIAFKILDDYRKKENIPEPSFEEYITDDEPAVRNVLGDLYSVIKFSLCLFHHNQNVIKSLAKHRLSNYIRKCKSDEQLWFYGKLKQILMIPLLPLGEIIPAFKSLSTSILSFIESQFTSPYEIDQFKNYFQTIEDSFFSNPEKIELICKHRKNLRSTNPIESTHNVFNKSTIIPRHGTVGHFIEGMSTIDLQFRSLAIAYEEKGACVLPKKKSRYVKQQAVITKCTMDLDNKKIEVEEFLKKTSECMIHEKYFQLIEAATERFEKSKDTEEDPESEIDDHIMAIFATSETTSGRVRILCSKYFGNDWLN